MKDTNLALIGAITLIVAILATITVLLVTGVILLDQVGPFLITLVVPITAIASLPIFKATLNAPSTDQLQQVQQQNQQLHGTLTQSIQALASAVQPTANMPTPEAEQPRIPYGPPSQSIQPSQSVPQQPFPPLTVPMAAMPRQ